MKLNVEAYLSFKLYRKKNDFDAILYIEKNTTKNFVVYKSIPNLLITNLITIYKTTNKKSKNYRWKISTKIKK